jgi:hypothetical protein
LPFDFSFFFFEVQWSGRSYYWKRKHPAHKWTITIQSSTRFHFHMNKSDRCVIISSTSLNPIRCIYGVFLFIFW